MKFLFPKCHATNQSNHFCGCFFVEDIVYSPNKYRETEGTKDNHASAILLLGIKDDNVYVLDEVYEFEKDTNELIQIAKAHGIPTNRVIWADSAEPDRIAMWNKAGYRRTVGVNKGGSAGSVKAQIDWLKQRQIFVHPHCINTIKEMQQWKWKKDEKTGEYLDEPVPIMDDAMAALRYGVESWRKPNGKVKAVRRLW